MTNHPYHSRLDKNRRRPRYKSSSETVITDDQSAYSQATSAATSVWTDATSIWTARTGDSVSVVVGNVAKKNNRTIIGGLVMALCLLNIIEVDIIVDDAGGIGRRSLLSTLYLAGPSTLLPWAQHHLVDVMDRPDPVAETALFWREFFSGVTSFAPPPPLTMLLCTPP
jgi:hypothetical protein